jgi:RNA recognition motif-containing protein
MKLHIGNLPTTVTDKELTDLIAPVAQPTSLQIIRDREGASKGFGFAEFATDEEARLVIAKIDGAEIAGKALKLGEAKPRRNDAAQGAQR